MGNGSSKHGDAVGDSLRDEFAKNRAARRKARAVLDSMPEHDWVDPEDTGRIEAVLNNSQVPSRARAAVGFLAVFPKEHRLLALIVLVALVLGLVALGAAKLLGAL
jgi:hypothetical protein